MSQLKKQVPRNAPCPCGSGRKFKNCCLDKSPDQAAKRSSRIVRGILIAAAVGILAVVVLFSNSPEPRNQPAPEGGNALDGLPLGTTPAPWEYDAANNRHWNPSHGHWHDGPPPSQTTPPTGIQTGVTPTPWQYDEANNRHWNPDHGHWHDGPPP